MGLEVPAEGASMEVIIVDRPDGAVVVSLHGQLDLDTASQLHDVLASLLLQPSPRIVVDLAALTFCDSIGLSALAFAHRRCVEAGGYLRLCSPRPFLRRVLTVVGLSPRLPAYWTVQAACAGDPAGLIAPLPPSPAQP
jgi:anti-anti-sigma factor